MSKVVARKRENIKLRENIKDHPLFTKNAKQIGDMVDEMDEQETKRLLKFLTRAVMSLLRED